MQRATSADALARRFRLASNKYIVCENAKIKVCQYQVMISNGLFEETNEQHIFSKVFFNEKSLMKNFFLQEIYNNQNKKWKYHNFVHAINCTRKLTCMCACTCVCDHTHVKEQYAGVIDMKMNGSVSFSWSCFLSL